MANYYDLYTPYIPTYDPYAYSPTVNTPSYEAPTYTPPEVDPWGYEDNVNVPTIDTVPTPTEIADGQAAAATTGSGENDLEQTIQDLAEQAAGVEIDTIDWENGQVIDAEGNVVKDYSDYYDQIKEAAETNIPSLDEYMTENEYQFNDPMAQDAEGNYTNPVMQDIEGLISEMRGGPTEADQQAADEYAAGMLNMSLEEYQAAMDELFTAVNAEIGEMEGMSEEERALRERYNRNELRVMEERAQRQIENIQASTGSASRSLAAADEAMRSINDAQVQQQVAMADEVWRRKESEHAAKERQWALMVENGRMAKSEYLRLVQDSKAQAFKGYALQIDAMYQQNKEYLERYKTELESVGMALDNTYKAVMTEMGVDAAMMDLVEDRYNMEMNPILTQLSILMGQTDMAMAQEEQDQSNMMGWVTIAIQTLGLFL